MKAIYLILIAMMAFVALFGCTQPAADNSLDANVPKIINQEQVDSATNDVSTDISGMNSTLNDIDSMLSD